MVNEKNKCKIKRYSCYYCNCTGFYSKKQIIFQIWNWGYQFVDREICKYCDGRGFVVFRHNFETTNNYQSYRDHWWKSQKYPIIWDFLPFYAFIVSWRGFNDSVQKIHFYFPTYARSNELFVGYEKKTNN